MTQVCLFSLRPQLVDVSNVIDGWFTKAFTGCTISRAQSDTTGVDVSARTKEHCSNT